MAVHLAQLNVARAVGPLDGPELAGFAAALEPVNALADAAPGFVWRLEDETETPGATAIRAFPDPWMLVNLSVWTSLDALRDFVYAGGHLAVLRRHREWFTRLRDAHQALWWVPEGVRPTVDEAVARLEHLREHGPTPEAFTFKRPFEAPADPPPAILERKIADG